MVKKSDARVRYQQLTLTPKRAKELIDRSARLKFTQRSLSKAEVERYAQMMRVGDWKFNGDTIKISKRGAVIDGQHRLAAIVLADVPVRTAIAWDVPEETFDTIDRGKIRSFREILGIQGEGSPQNLSTALMWLHLYEYRNMHKRYKRTAQDVMHCLERNPKLRQSVDFARNLSGTICSKGLIAFAHYIFRHTAKLSEVEEFFRRLSDGVMLKKGDPILVLRNRLIDNKHRRLGRGKLRAVDILALMFKAWRHHLADEKIERLLWKQGKYGPKGKEDFPYLKDPIAGRKKLKPGQSETLKKIVKAVKKKAAKKKVVKKKAVKKTVRKKVVKKAAKKSKRKSR
jgi:hypothetical protein